MQQIKVRKYVLLQKMGHRLLVSLLIAVSFLTFSSTLFAENQITIASFNLRIFGTAKAERPAILQEIASIISKFDIVAVQEIRDKSGTAVKELLAAVNANSNYHYDMLIGPRVGRTSSKEQYAFFYRTSLVVPIGSTATWQDISHKFEREPFFAMFIAAQGTFDFILADLHTKPEDATNEIRLIPGIMKDGATLFNDPDIICLGDWNADGSYFDEDTYGTLFPSSEFLWIIPNTADTTIASKSNTYDRMAASFSMKEDWTGEWGVFRFDEESTFITKGIIPTDISDHYLVWATFYTEYDTE